MAMRLHDAMSIPQHMQQHQYVWVAPLSAMHAPNQADLSVALQEHEKILELTGNAVPTT
ncbi:hypothetical protein [Cupriavidus numazuensis]|uniref:hypothetical protein n=1 Tax=Cupriavidus numazuensis TaxID=221992 RepID=UPI001BAC9C58|nr:hypothetical protein [Cupriavidus numazuensis]